MIPVKILVSILPFLQQDKSREKIRGKSKIEYYIFQHTVNQTY